MRLIAALLVLAFSACLGAQELSDPPNYDAPLPDTDEDQRAGDSTKRRMRSFAELQRLVAPVALYPDTVLSLVLAAATYPDDVADAARWSRSNGVRRGEPAIRAALGRPWDTSVMALVGFPELLAQMHESMDWTRQLGRAFLANEAAVLDAVQALRARAAANGRLQSSSELRVERRGTRIAIESGSNSAIWLPHYDPVAALGADWSNSAPPVRWPAWPGHVRRGGLFAWGAPIPISRGFLHAGIDWRDRFAHVASIRNYQALPANDSLPSERTAVFEAPVVREARAVREPAVVPAPAEGVTRVPSRPVSLVSLMPVTQAPRAAPLPDRLPAGTERAQPQQTQASEPQRAPLVALGRPDAGRLFTPPAVLPEKPPVAAVPPVHESPVHERPLPAREAPVGQVPARELPALQSPEPPLIEPVVPRAEPLVQTVPAAAPAPASEPKNAVVIAPVPSVAQEATIVPAASVPAPRPRPRVFMSDMDSRTLDMLGGRGAASKVDRLHP